MRKNFKKGKITMTNCLFCKIAAKELPANIVFESDEVVAFHDIRPQAPTHIQVIPKRHISTINDCEAGDELLIGRMVLTAKTLAAQNGFSEQGYRLVFNINSGGGQEIYHIHLHILGGRQMMWPPG